jgi:hypothetical protein
MADDDMIQIGVSNDDDLSQFIQTRIDQGASNLPGTQFTLDSKADAGSASLMSALTAKLSPYIGPGGLVLGNFDVNGVRLSACFNASLTTLTFTLVGQW